MAISNLKSLGLLALAMAAAQVHAAAQPPVQQTIDLVAQSSELDLRNDNALFRKVRIAQGATTVTADLGSATKQATGLNFDNSLWVFRGNVRITMDNGELTSDDAEINFAKKALAKAVVNGKPAAFEQRVAKTGKVAHGRADTIKYDAGKGLVRLWKNAWLSDGQTEISNESLKYNVLTQSIVAESSEQGSQRVHIIITPQPSKP